uniref:C2H2-type domain-containing protein n=1 Tax=Leptobrachium leishanense TaxID=445787 RepID=A0A8C5QCQ7_9ANUR
SPLDRIAFEEPVPYVEENIMKPLPEEQEEIMIKDEALHFSGYPKEPENPGLSSGIFLCPDSEICLSTNGSLGKHRVHVGQKLFACSECGKYFTTKRGNLTVHEKLHTGVKPFACSECEKCFTTKGNLTVHESLHTGVKPFTCSECEKCCRTKGELTSHERIHTGVKTKHELTAHERIHTREKLFACSECGKCFTTKSNLTVHEKLHTGVKPFACSECEKCFTTKGNLTVHESLHTGVKELQHLTGAGHSESLTCDHLVMRPAGGKPWKMLLMHLASCHSYCLWVCLVWGLIYSYI